MATRVHRGPALKGASGKTRSSSRPSNQGGQLCKEKKRRVKDFASYGKSSGEEWGSRSKEIGCVRLLGGVLPLLKQVNGKVG